MRAEARPVRPAARQLHPVRTAAAASTALAAAVVLVGVVAPAAAAAAGPVLLITGLLLGLPHGAVDHLVPAWTGLTHGGGRPMAVVLVGYTAAAVLAWTALTFAGPVAVLVLLAVSVVHFGLGDVMAERSDRGDAGSARVAVAAAVLARGGPVVVFPLALWPQVADPVLGAFDPAVPALLTPGARAGLLGGLVLCAAVAVVEAVRRGLPRDAAEVVLLSALFAVLPPFAAFGIYFGGWHALRHTARLLAADPRNADDLAAGSWRGPLRRFTRSAAAPTAIVLASVVLLVLLARQPVLFVPVLAVLLALTVPHVIVVGALDRATLTRRSRG